MREIALQGRDPVPSTDEHRTTAQVHSKGPAASSSLTPKGPENVFKTHERHLAIPIVR